MRRWLPILIILLIAAILRLVLLPDVPPGLQHDEVFHGHDAVTVLLGYHPLYFNSNAGNEPLFVYLMALTVGLFGANVWGIRLAAVSCGLLTILFTYLWLRRAYQPRLAVLASALLAVSFWPLFLSRVGLRAVSVPMMAALSAWLLFEALQRQQRRWFVVAGAALGLSLYTYPAARTLPIVYILFFTFYSLLTRKLNRPVLITLVTALIVFAPLGYTIATQPQADERLQQLGGPVQEFLKGNIGPVLGYARDTLGMFNFAGDPIARYNLPGRPVFDALTGILFLLGLGLALRRWREPRNLFALLWLPIGLLPSMLSDSAPSFLRASAALPVTFLFPALAVDWLLSCRKDAKAQRILWGLTAVWLITVGVLTVRDYFVVWPARSDVREVYRTDLAEAAKWIEQQPDDQAIVVASTNPRDLDPFLFDFQLTGKHEVKWIDRAFAVAFPASGGKLISPAYSPIDPQLRDRFLSSPIFTATFQDGSTAFEVFDLAPRYADFTPTRPITGSIDFGHSIELVGSEEEPNPKAGGSLKLTLYWRVFKDTSGQQLPLSLFVHVLNEHGEFVTGRDLLAFPTAGWRNGDVWIQQNDVPLPADLKPGGYQVEIGVYSQADGSRWRVYDKYGQDIGDRLWFSAISVTP